MIMTFNECMVKYGNAYQINKAIENKEIYKLEEGIYSDQKYESELSVITKKYPKAILTGDYAYYVHEMTDLIPEKYYLATKANAAPISDKRVIQVYVPDKLLEIGLVELPVNGVNVRIYDKERMLVELLRNKNKLPYDLYKEIVGNYRKIINDLEIWRIQEYLDLFPKSKMTKKAFDEEVL